MMVLTAAWVIAFAAIVVIALRSGLPGRMDAAALVFGVVYAGLAAAVLTAIVVAIPLRIVLNVAMKSRRRSHRAETVMLTAVLALSVAWILEVRRERNRLAPPRGVRQLAEFARLAPPPRWLELVRHDGDDYIAWFGPVSGPIDIPSGPACYLFDKQGELIDWQPETGDGGSVESFLHSSSRAGKISLEEALTLTRKPAAAEREDPSN